MTDQYEVIRKVLAECRDIAMEWTMRGRIPECGKFGQIAQDLDYVCAELDSAISECDALLRERIRQAEARAVLLVAALRDCYKLAYNCHRDELPTAIIMAASKAIAITE